MRLIRYGSRPQGGSQSYTAHGDLSTFMRNNSLKMEYIYCKAYFTIGVTQV